MKASTSTKYLLALVPFLLVGVFCAPAYAAINFNYSLAMYSALENSGAESSNPEDIIKGETEKTDYLIERAEKAVSELERKTRFRTFLVGSDLGDLRYSLVQIKDEKSKLKELTGQVGVNITKVNELIHKTTQAQLRVENLVLAKEKEFSLFGWFVGII